MLVKMHTQLPFLRGQKLERTYIYIFISPIERITIPRLELLAVTIGVKLWRSIKEAGDFEEVFFWSDSSTVVAWIRKDKLWNTFVEYRVREIRSLSDPNKWRHVPGSMKPVDLPSRGCGAKHLVESLWWEGPAWLKLPADQWPSSDDIENEEEINSEIKKSAYRKKRFLIII